MNNGIRHDAGPVVHEHYVQHVISTVTRWVNTCRFRGVDYFQGVGVLDVRVQDVSRGRAYPGVPSRMFDVEIPGSKCWPAAVVHKPRDVCGPESLARGLVHRREVQVYLRRMHNDGGFFQRPEIPTGYARVCGMEFLMRMEVPPYGRCDVP